MSASSLNRSGATRSRGKARILDNSLRASSNHSEHTVCHHHSARKLSPHRRIAILLLLYYWSAIIYYYITGKRTVRSTELDPSNTGTAALELSSPTLKSLRTANIMPVVERCGQNLYCSSGSSPLASQSASSMVATILGLTREYLE